MSWRERDPKKRKVKPVEQPIFDLDLESSDDSDFDPDNHKEVTDDSLDSNDEGSAKDSGSDDETDSSESEDDDGEDLDEALPSQGPTSAEDLQRQLESGQDVMKSEIAQKLKKKVAKRCWGCLGDRNDEFDELVECDECGLTVHEKCYGMSDSESLASDDSKNPVLPWFCDACRAGVKDPPCELCPNTGGMMKETDMGKWVHVVCSLYIPGLFPPDPDVERISLQKMSYTKWGAKRCSICDNERLSRTGVCVGCDAGMCRMYFHVTCAQRAGLLHEAHLEEAEQVDRFYAHCKLHSDKAQIRRRRQNFLLLQDRLKERNLEVEAKDPSEVERIRRKFGKARRHYWEYKRTNSMIWSPPQKVARALITSATACRRFWRKAELMGIDTRATEDEEAQVAALKDIGRKWHIPAAFSVEFIGYFLDRPSRIDRIKKQLQEFSDQNSQLVEEQKSLGEKYDQVMKEKEAEDQRNTQLRKTLEIYHAVLTAAVPNKKLPSIDSLCQPPPSKVPETRAPSFGPVLTPAALKAGYYQGARRESGNLDTLNHRPNAEASPVLSSKCGICRQGNDPHLLAQCDTCSLFYHLGCLNPPLTRMPKTTKQMGWQCSECDKESSGSDVPCLDPEAPRRLRHNKREVSAAPKVTIKPVVEPEPEDLNSSFSSSVIEIEDTGAEADSEAPSIIFEKIEKVPHKSSKKRRREKHHRYSPDLIGGYGSVGGSGERKRKRKKKSSSNVEWPEYNDTIQLVPRIKIKPIPNPTGVDGQPSLFVASAMMPSEESLHQVAVPQTPALPAAPSYEQPAQHSRPERQSGGARKRPEEVMTNCVVCRGEGSKDNMVKCDECLKCFHFLCLDPPVKKSPKIRGYSWHCADCDPTDTGTD